MRFLLNISLILITGIVFSQQASLDIAVSKTTVTNNEPFTYQVTADCDCKIEPPSFDGFEVLDRSQGQFTSSQIINGVSSKSCSSTITFVLKAKKLGSVNIGKSKVKCKNSDKKSESINITVVDANEAHSANQGVARFFYQLETNKKEVFVGEPFILTFSLYSEKMPEEITTIVNGNALGLWRQKLFDEAEPGYEFKKTTSTIKGKRYNVIELRRELCFADVPGNLHIDPYFGRAVEQYGFFENKYFEEYSNSLDIKVKALPIADQDDYYGMAGEFDVNYEVSQTSVAANRAFELDVTVSGTGNFHLFKGPDFLFPESFLVNEPEVTESFGFSPQGVTGSVKYNYVITPTKRGDYSILPFMFSYYDWNSRRLKQVGTDQISIKVTKGKEAEIISSDPGKNPLVEDDIRHIHSENNCSFKDGDLLFSKLIYWILLVLPLLSVAIYFWWKRIRSNKSEEEVILEKQKQTKRATVRNIDNIKSDETGNSVKALKQTLEEYFITNFQVGRSGISKRSISEELNHRNVSDQTILAFEAIWDKIEMAQYAPMSNENIDVLASQTKQLIESLNKQL